LANLNIRKPDYYSNNHADGRMFTSTQNQSTTAYVWLDKFTKNNLVRVKNDESVIDEGENNTIVHEYPE
jgi:hypothetical protein